jgi:predicted dehydrogenase
MAGEEPVQVGVIGCGAISEVYLPNCMTMPGMRVAACADLNPERARARAEQFGVPRILEVGELLEDEEIEVVLNLTIPLAHGELNQHALLAGKHVYSEKPLAVNREDGRRLLEEAASRNLLVGCAPDTFLGPAWQACRRAIDDGVIGEPVAASAFMMTHGHESWHPDPDFFYAAGGGPLFDMGPYYLTALVSLLGPVRRVTGSARVTFPQRTITSRPRHGETITVTTPTHIAGVMEFMNGAVVTLVTSFDVWNHTHPPIEIYGTEGILLAADPNHFAGHVQVQRMDDQAWHDIYPDTGPGDDLRGIGLSGLAAQLRGAGRLRASGELAYHVLDVMQAFLEAAETGRHIDIASAPARPDPLEEYTK